MDRSTITFVDWEIKSHGFKLPCISSIVVDYDALLRKCVCNISVKKYKFQFIYYTAKGKDGVLISHILRFFS